MPVLSWLTFDTGMNQEGADCTPLLRYTTDTLYEIEPFCFKLKQEHTNLQGHPNPENSLRKLMLWLFGGFKETATMADLDVAIAVGNAALKLRSSVHSFRDDSLYILSRCLSARFQKLGSIDDLEGAITHSRAALALRLPDHPHRATFLYHLASDLHCRFQKIGTTSNLWEAITLARDALNLRPSGHPDRTASLNDLLVYVMATFDCDEGGGTTNIMDIICVPPLSVVDGCPHREKLDFLYRLSDLLLNKVQSQGHSAALEGAIKLHQDILKSCPLNHPELAPSLHKLGHYLSERFDKQGVPDDLERAIALTYPALDLCPPGHSDRAMLLQSLAIYRQKKIMEPRTEVLPEGIKRIIRDVLDDTLETLPPRLLNTQTGLMCGRDVLMSDFESSKQCQELLVKDARDVVTKADVRKTVSKYFRFVALSHRWGKCEPLLNEIKGHAIHIISDPTVGIIKLQQFCAAAGVRDYLWAWSDTCCIDKDSSVELQEAIGSMYSWYQSAALTIVHLADVTDGSLSGSEWFRRGWTLQELLASKTVLFFTRNWTLYKGCTATNHKEDDAVLKELEEATSIASKYLTDFRPGMDDARSRLQWASQRRTTRPEDAAYSLFGIFGVFLPIFYGESKQKAFGRLLEEIISKSGDISVLDWIGEQSSSHSCFPASITSYAMLPVQNTTVTQVTLPNTPQAEPSEVVDKLYSSLSNSKYPRFTGRRLRLPCIVHRVTAINSGGSLSDPQMHEIRAEGLVPLMVSLSDKLQENQPKVPYVLVRPWNPKLLLESSLTGASPVEQVIATLGQPFNALLLEELPLNEYKRIASSSLISACPADADSIFQSEVRTLNIV